MHQTAPWEHLQHLVSKCKQRQFPLASHPKQSGVLKYKLETQQKAAAKAADMFSNVGQTVLIPVNYLDNYQCYLFICGVPLQYLVCSDLYLYISLSDICQIFVSVSAVIYLPVTMSSRRNYDRYIQWRPSSYRVSCDSIINQ
jgi:hypothetical protein